MSTATRYARRAAPAARAVLRAAVIALLPLLTACSARAPVTTRSDSPPVLAEPRHLPPPPAVRTVSAIDAAALADAIALDVVEGEATYYASYFDGRRTASGEVFRNSDYTAAHRHYPFGTILRVTNLVNDRSVIVRVTDRGPFGSSARARATIIDLSQSAAADLDFIRRGRVPVRVEVLAWGS